MKSRFGFTLFEVMTTMAIIVILGIAITVNLQGGKNNTDLADTTKQVASLLREAQSDSMAQEQNAIWGVYFSNATNTAPFYSLFINSYATSTRQNYYRLPAPVGFVSSSLASGASESVTFSRISGIASTATKIKLYSIIQPALSSTISIASSGAVSD